MDKETASVSSSESSSTDLACCCCCHARTWVSKARTWGSCCLLSFLTIRASTPSWKRCSYSRSSRAHSWSNSCRCCSRSNCAAPEATSVTLARPHILAVAVLAFPFPVGQHCAHHHCHWCHWLHCHCSSCFFLVSRLQALVSCPVPIFWIVSHDIGGMRYEVSSTRQCHILVASRKQVAINRNVAMSLPMCLSNAGVIDIVGPYSSK